MRTKLTNASVKKLAAKSNRYEVSDTTTPALRLRISPTGLKTFILLYRNSHARQRRLTIGRFPGITTDQARDIASKALAEVALGNDPAEQRQHKRREAEREKSGTLGAFLKTYAPWLESHRKTGKESIERIKYCFPQWMDKPLSDLNPWLLEGWRKDRRKAGRAESTINRDMNALRSLNGGTFTAWLGSSLKATP